MGATPLSPSSSQEIISISPPVASSSKLKPELATTLPKARSTFDPSPALKERIRQHIKDDKMITQSPSPELRRAYKRARDADVKEVRGKGKMSRSQQTERMMNSLGRKSNPITNSDIYSRTDHFVSCATGHQQSNRGGGSSGAATYWEVRTAKMTQQAREGTGTLFAGCVFYINGSTGPRVSNLQLQHIITANGGRFLPMQSSSCTHTIAGNLSGTKAQKHINGQGTRGAARRSKVVRVDWILDSVEQGKKLSEAGYTIIEDPSQHNLFTSFGVKPKAEQLK